MLVVNIFVRACTALALSIFIPPIIRICDCSTIISFVILYLILFNICFQLYIVASLAVFQLLIIKGKKKFVNYKTIGIILFIITVLTIVLPIIFLGLTKYFTGEAASCHNTIGCAGLIVDATQLLLVIASFEIVAWAPSVSILVGTTIWSCAIFKKNYAGHDSGLTRRIVAMPLVVPVMVSLISIAVFASYRVVDIISLRTLVDNSFSRNWNASLRFIVVVFNEIAGGLSYPCLILFLNPKLWESWKELALFWKKNQVTPE